MSDDGPQRFHAEMIHARQFLKGVTLPVRLPNGLIPLRQLDSNSGALPPTSSPVLNGDVEHFSLYVLLQCFEQMARQHVLRVLVRDSKTPPVVVVAPNSRRQM